MPLPIEAHAVLGRLASRVGGQHAATDVLEPSHPKPRVKLPRQPAGHAYMVRVQMCDDDAGHRKTLHGAGKGGAPGARRLLGLDARIDNGVALAVPDRPDIDEFQRAAERHAQPLDAGRDLDGVPGSRLRNRLEGIGQDRATLLLFDIFAHPIPLDVNTACARRRPCAKITPSV